MKKVTVLVALLGMVSAASALHVEISDPVPSPLCGMSVIVSLVTDGGEAGLYGFDGGFYGGAVPTNDPPDPPEGLNDCLCQYWAVYGNFATPEMDVIKQYKAVSLYTTDEEASDSHFLFDAATIGDAYTNVIVANPEAGSLAKGVREDKTVNCGSYLEATVGFTGDWNGVSSVELAQIVICPDCCPPPIILSAMVSVDYVDVPVYEEICIPEPATIALLSLTGLLLRRRR